MDSEFEEVFIDKIEEYTRRKVPNTGIFSKAHKDGLFYFGNKMIKIEKEQVGAKEVGEIVWTKFKEALEEAEIEQMREIAGIA